MIKLENFEVVGWEHAIRGMRNPMNSWEKSEGNYRYALCARCDDCEAFKSQEFTKCDGCEVDKLINERPNGFMIGPNDHSLMMKLRNAGTDHRKFMRMITVYVDITAPLYWWKEFDTYKVGTVANSCSTMHKIHSKRFDISDFSIDQLNCDIPDCFYDTLDYLNESREKYLKTKDKKYWWQMIQLLPSSYNQRRTIMMSYENLANMYKPRKNHKLDEWREFCAWAEKLPYSEIITGEVEENG